MFQKSIVHEIKHVNFQLYRAHSDRVIWKKTDNWRQIYKQRVWLIVHQHQTMSLSRAEKKKLFGRNGSSHLCEKTVTLLLKMCSGNHGTIIRMYNTFVLYFHDETERNCKLLIRNFNSTWKKSDFSTSISETSENVYLFISVS